MENDEIYKHVYIIDDDKMVRESTHLWLSVYGYLPRSFSSPVEFLDQLQDLKPGCALIDVRMPVISGIEMLEKYGQRLKRLAIIMMTGHADVAMTATAIKLGAVDFIEKPFKQDKLISSIELALSNLANRSG